MYKFFVTTKVSKIYFLFIFQCRQRHERSSHEEAKPKYKCRHCANKFGTNNPEVLKRHTLNHIEKWNKLSHGCPNEDSEIKCKFRAANKHSLAIHKGRCDKFIVERFRQPSVIVKNNSFKVI